MRGVRFGFLATACLAAATVGAEPSAKRLLDQGVPADWPTVGEYQISPDGRYATYALSTPASPTRYIVKDVDSLSERTLPEGADAPIFGDGDKVKKKATVTVLHNGVLVQDNSEIYGPTTHEPIFPMYKRHDKGPIILQDHGNPTRFRNIWLREL